MRIGELGDLCGVTTKTVRYYESIGLLDEPARTAGGYRDYTTDSVERLRFIRDAKAAGLTLSEISSVLEIKDSGDQSCAHTTTLIDSHISQIDVQIEQLTTTRSELALLAKRSSSLDPSTCTDPNRCQVITKGRSST